MVYWRLSPGHHRGIPLPTALVFSWVPLSKGVMSSKRAAALIVAGVIWSAFTLSGVNHLRWHARATTLGAGFYPETVAQAIGSVVINELMYHPASDLDEEEYVELTNIAAITVDLSGCRFSDGFDYTFPSGTLLPPGGYLVVAHDPDAVASRYGLDPGALLGPFAARRLSNNGERVALQDGSGELVDEVTYGDASPWPGEPDGHGPSLELINPTFDDDRACSWAASDGQGTPGTQNSVYASDVPPCVENVIHSPVFPTSSQPIIVTAHIDDNGTLTSAIVYHRRDASALFDATPMPDNGSGIYTAQLPPYPAGSLVEFYVEAMDDAGLATRMPLGAPETTSPETGRPITIGYLFLVEDTPPACARPCYRLLVTAENWTELTTRDLYSNELLDATFIHAGEIYYNVGLRYRGESSRPGFPKSYRVNFPASHLFHPAGWDAGSGVERLNLVGDHISREALSYDLFRRAGMVASETAFVDLYINSAYQALYLTVEQVDEAFTSAHLPGDDAGNLYRAQDGGDLSYRGPYPDTYRPYYLKKSNEGADDYADIIALTDALDNSPDESFKDATEAVADMAEWLRWFAINAVVFNTEGALFMGQGDDYFLYHRPSDDRFILIPWDHDATFYQATGDIWAPNLRIVKRILRHPPFTRLYYQNIADLMAHEFAVATMHPLIDALPPELDGEKGQLKGFVTDRINYLTSYFNNNVPDRPLTITTNAGSSFTTTQRTVVLEGGCSPWRDVYVNDRTQGVAYPSIYDWHYTIPPLRPRANRFVVTDKDSSGSVVTTHTITVTYDAFDGGTLSESLTLTLDTSPHIILDDIIVPPGLTLTIEPGVTVAFAEGTSLFVEGRLLAEGTVGQPITFTRDQDSGYWGAIGIYGSREDNRLAHVLVEYAGQVSYKGHTFSGVGAYDGQLTLRDSEVRDTSQAALDLVASSAYLRRNRVHDTAGGAGLRAQRSYIQAEDNLFYSLGGHGFHLSDGEGSAGSIVRHNVVYGVQGDCINLDNLAVPLERNELHHCTGAGVSLYHSARLTLTNNLIRHNVVGVAVQGGAPAHLAHNTLAHNNTGLAVYDATGQAMLVNSIVWGNGTAVSYTAGASITVSYSDMQGGWPGEGNINADPQFRHPDLGIFRLLETSPCIDQATPQGAAPVDLLGIPRPKGDGYDMGAFEFFEYYAVYLPLVARKP